MTINDIGYLEGYMSKVALGPAGAAVADLAVAGGSRAATGLGKIMLPLALAAPVATGAAAGALHSKATSPTAMDSETAQRALVSAELDEMLVALQRRQAKAKQAEKEKKEQEKKKESTTSGAERTLHI
jgi:hypothetical protein